MYLKIKLEVGVNTFRGTSKFFLIRVSKKRVSILSKKSCRKE